MQAQRPNFFLLLELNPDAPWERVLFEKALREKRGVWSRQSSGVAKKALSARQNLALIPAIWRVMMDQEARGKEAAAAREELASFRQEEYAHFEQQLAFLNAREMLEQEEVNAFVAAFKHLFSEAEILSRLQAKIVTAPQPAQSPASALDPSFAGSINDRLSFLHMSTLYELLTLPRTTSTRELLRAAQRLYTRLVLLPPTAEVDAQIELAGLAQSAFRSEETRSSYDTSVHQQSLDRLLKDLDESMERSSNKELYQKQVMVFLEHAQRGGWSEQEALERLKEHVRLRKWIATLPALSPESQRLLCPNCENLNESGQRYCTRCMQALTVNCPACQHVVPCEAISCGHCGFAVGNRYLVDHLLATLEGRLQHGDIARAGDVLREAEQAWPAPASDPRVQRVNEFKAAILQLARAQRQARQDAMTFHERLRINEAVLSGGRVVHIAWQPPASGVVVILRSNQDLQQQGKILPRTQADQLGTRLADRGHFATDAWRSGEVIYYTPAILLHQQAFLGASRPYSCVEKISHLTYQHLGPTLRLRWHWPDNCQEALVSHHPQHWPQHHAPRMTTCHVPRTEYERQGYYDLRDLSGEYIYIVVSSLFPDSLQPRLSPGTRLCVRMTGKVVLTYDVKPATFRSRKRILRLATDPPQPLPVLLLIRKQGGLPLNKTDGHLYHRIEASSESRKSIDIELPSPLLPPETFAKVFLEDDAAYSEFIVHHPSQEKLRLR